LVVAAWKAVLLADPRQAVALETPFGSREAAAVWEMLLLE
jgi:hypothetical protein